MKYQIKNNLLAAFLFSLSVSAIKTHSQRKLKGNGKIPFMLVIYSLILFAFVWCEQTFRVVTGRLYQTRSTTLICTHLHLATHAFS